MLVQLIPKLAHPLRQMPLQRVHDLQRVFLPFEPSQHMRSAATEAMESVMAALINPLPIPPPLPTAANLRLGRAKRRLDSVVYRMLTERRATPETGRSDRLSILLAARDEVDHTGRGRRLTCCRATFLDHQHRRHATPSRAVSGP